MNERDLARMHQTLLLARRAPARVEFEESGAHVKLTDSQGFETTIPINRQGVTETVFDGGDVETKARWDEETLVIERRVDGGGKVTERYTLGLGATRLLVFVEVDRLLQPLAFTRQYERVEE
jgi:hypothetical protein